MVGANVYLTPPGTQGFAPHFDDVDVFILQLEGKKHWRLYEPKPEDRLPRFSSRNFTQNEIGDPCLETTLDAGDMLYVYFSFLEILFSLKSYNPLITSPQHVNSSSYNDHIRTGPKLWEIDGNDTKIKGMTD